jgi:hypothetical protein
MTPSSKYRNGWPMYFTASSFFYGLVRCAISKPQGIDKYNSKPFVVSCHVFNNRIVAIYEGWGGVLGWVGVVTYTCLLQFFFLRDEYGKSSGTHSHTLGRDSTEQKKTTRDRTDHCATSYLSIARRFAEYNLSSHFRRTKTPVTKLVYRGILLSVITIAFGKKTSKRLHWCSLLNASPTLLNASPTGTRQRGKGADKGAAPVCFGFLQLLATKSCCGLPNTQLFSQLL